MIDALLGAGYWTNGLGPGCGFRDRGLVLILRRARAVRIVAEELSPGRGRLTSTSDEVRTAGAWVGCWSAFAVVIALVPAVS